MIYIMDNKYINNQIDDNKEIGNGNTELEKERYF
jgi:hypothetical protein